jgi:hypothetical protein
VIVMPFKDPERRNQYFRDLMRKRRAAAKAGVKPEGAAVKPAAVKPGTDGVKPSAAIRRCAFCSGASGDIHRLWGIPDITPMICEACVKRAQKAWADADKADAPEPTQSAAPEPKAKRPTRPKPEQPAFNLAEARKRTDELMRADHEADLRERAIYGGRPKHIVVDDIGRLLRGKGLADDVKQTIIDVMLPHVAKQDNIQRGIPRATYRKVCRDLYPGPPKGKHASREAFEAFTGLDVTVMKIKHREEEGERIPNPKSIVIAADKVTTMADYWRKQAERSAKAKAAAAKRKAEQTDQR